MNDNVTSKQASKQARRDSGIELLKIFAILLIITSHVVQTLGSTPSFFPAHDFVIKIEEASSNPQMLIVSMLRYSGAFGNALFFICSAWFLIDRKRNEKPKALQMIADIKVILRFFFHRISPASP